MRRTSGLRQLWTAAVKRLTCAFAERDILIRANGRVRFVRLGPRVQIAIAALLVMILPPTAHTVIKSAFFPSQIIAEKSAEIARLKVDYERLRGEASESQSRYRAITQHLEAKHDYLLGVIAQNTAMQSDLGQLRGALQRTESERASALAARETLLERLSQLDGSLKAMAAEKSSLMASLERKWADQREANQERERADQLQERLTVLQIGQQEVLKRLSARTAGSIGEVRDLIAMTGLDADRLLARTAVGSGIGGPFVEFDLDREEPPVDTQIAALNSHIDQWDELQQVLRRLPLSAPVDNYVLMSPYGKRKDPINGKWAMHAGVDLGGHSKAPVLSAGPGVVIFAGINGSYGRMVEIDHGMGIRTRYGHLSSLSVRKGQRVDYRQSLGVIGSSGRSTGTHLHYEVLVNDTPHDPMKFIQAGKHVFKG